MSEIANIPRCAKTYDPVYGAKAMAPDYQATEAIDRVLARGLIRPSPEPDSLSAIALIAAAALLALIAALLALVPEQLDAALVSITK